MNRKSQLKQQYRQMKPPMGILIIRSRDGKVYLEPSRDLKSAMNKNVFQLKWGSHPNKELQQAWNQYGAATFSVGILDSLDYAKDDAEADYGRDLHELLLLWADRLAQDNVTLYGK